MKIDHIYQPQEILSDSVKDKRAAPKPGDDFAAMLGSEMSQVDEMESDAVVSGPDPAFSVPCLTGILADPDAAGRISDLEDVLASLQSLENGLRENTSPKAVEEIIQKIGAASDKLRESARGLPEDAPLSRIAEEANIAAYMESIKWRRGDYL